MSCGCNGGALRQNNNLNLNSLLSYEWDWTSFAAGIIGGVLILTLGIYGSAKYLMPAIKGEKKQNGLKI